MLGRVVADFKDNIVELDEQCHPALEALTRRADKVTLDHVRQLKNRHSSLTKSVEAVVEELERIMDDDDDMKKVRKEKRQSGSSLSSSQVHRKRKKKKRERDGLTKCLAFSFISEDGAGPRR